MTGALDGIKVLEFGQIIAGPMCGVLLSDFGADVVKVESPTGDATRLLGQFVPHESKIFHAFNRGKRGIVVDVRQDQGRDVILRLVEHFDVFLINSRPGVADRLGIDYDSLRARRPDLIYLDNTAYGPEGPSAHRSGADIVAQAYSGLMANDEKYDEHGGPDFITATAPADFAAAWTSAMAVCAALFHRERSGEGQRIETSLLGGALTMQNFLLHELPAVDAIAKQPVLDAIAEARARGGSYREIMEARGSIRNMLTGAMQIYYGGYETADGAIMLGCTSPVNRQQVRDAIGLADDPTDTPDFNALDPNADAIVAEVRGRVQQIFRSNTCAHWIERLDATGAPASQVNIIEDIPNDPQVQALDMYIDIEHPLTGPETVIGPGFRMSATPPVVQGPSPTLDGDTDAVLADHGFDAEEIQSLRSSGAIGLPATEDS